MSTGATSCNQPATTSSTSWQPNQKFTVKSELLQLLNSVGAEGNSFTLIELRALLGKYIQVNKLYNPNDLLQINAESDPLGQVFGEKTFHARWALNRLNSFLLPVGRSIDLTLKESGSTTQMDSVLLKRKLADDTNPTAKRLCPDYYFEFRKPPEVESETETVYSVQGHETASAKDSDDDFTVLTDWEADFDYDDRDANDVEVEVEYEVTSLPSDLDSDSAPSITDAMAFILENVETDIEFWADSSNCENDMPTSEDPDIPDSDKWLCNHCKSLNKPTIRFCERCWQMRQNWLPDNPRPPKRERKKKKKRRKDWPRKRPQRSSVTLEAEITSNTEEPAAGPSSQETSSNKSDASTNKSETLCFMCYDRPCDGCIIHGSTGHMIGCYKCLKLLKHKDKPCPICRAPIQKVIKVFKE